MKTDQNKDSNIGSKAKNLFLLKSLNYKTKPFCVVSAAEIQKNKTNVSFVKFLSDENNLKIHNKNLYAVRSSSSVEDSANFSYAGAFETLLNVRASDLLSAALEVCVIDDKVGSNYDPNLKLSSEIKMSVIIQEMVESKYSGVCFSRSPKAPTSDLVIEYGKGLGDLVVEGRGETEHIYFDYFLNQLTENQTECPDDILKELAYGSKALERELGAAVDVEWAFDGEDLYFLQVRPITTSLPILEFFADANLCESYPRYTAPLTCSLVKKLYESSFSDGARFFGASTEKKEKLAPYYKTMVQDFKGHLYYNLASYQEALVGLPKGQAEFNEWLGLIGFDEYFQMPKPQVKAPNLLESLNIILRMIRFRLFRKKEMSAFFNKAEGHLNKLREELGSANTSEAILNLVKNELQKPQNMVLAIINDRFIMLHSEKLMQQHKEGVLTFDELQKSLTLGSHIDSLSPQWALSTLRTELESSSDWALIKKISEDHECLSLKEFKELVSVDAFEFVSKYVDKFGYRNFNDLKLEGTSFRQNTVLLLKLILKQQTKSSVKPQAEKKKKKLSFFEQSVFYREQARLLRSEYIAWFREAFIEIEGILISEGILFSVSDVFYFSLEELSCLLEVKKSRSDVTEIVEKQKELELSRLDYPKVIVTEDGLYLESTVKSYAPKKSKNQNELFGLFVSGESVGGEVLVVADPESIPKGVDLSDKVLVTETTDPAWVFYMTQCRALVSERGGLLSHTAIIGRELKKTTLVKVDGATKFFKNGDLVFISSESQSIKKVNK